MIVLDAILSFLGGIAEAVTGFFDFLFSLLSDLVYLVQLTGKMLSQIPSFFSWLPAPVLAIIVTTVTIAVLLKVIGRD